MSNWKHEELKGIEDAIRLAAQRAASAPRAEGKCQMLIYAHRDDGEAGIRKRIRCMECGYEDEGYNAEIVTRWNDHIIYR